MRMLRRELSAEHWLLLGGFLAVVGAQIAAMDTWSKAFTPGSVGGLIIQVALLLRAMYSDKPQPKEDDDYIRPPWGERD